MKHLLDHGVAEDILTWKRKHLGRGLSYTEKVLFLHEQEPSSRGEQQDLPSTIRVYPDRVAMQDATAQMAMLQFMQTGRERVLVPTTIHCDHLLRASQGAEEDLQTGLTAHQEIYDFLSSSAQKYGIGFWGAGSGIIHQVLLENYAVPGGLMIGTDSHTPNAGGLGMLAIGVGGSDAVDVMAGLTWETLMPLVVGVELTGRLAGWASAKDVVLEMLRRFTVKGGTGRIFEYFGEGARYLSATQKATIANMGAEMGATASVFVYDESMDAYLRSVGRVRDADQARAKAHLLMPDDVCQKEPAKVYCDYVQLDLSTVSPAHAGPDTPDRVTRVKDFRALLQSEALPEAVSAVLAGSCTNSSYGDLWTVANILEQARCHGIAVRVPFLIAPGSRSVYDTAKRDGLLDSIRKGGGTLLATACGPCIGQWDRKDVAPGTSNLLFTTFNRNFRARNDGNPETRTFLTSPALAAALALAGDAGFDPETGLLTGADGHPFSLEHPSPPPLPPDGLLISRQGYVPPVRDGSNVTLLLRPGSHRLESLRPFEPWDGKDFLDLPVLVKTRGKTTTDHISPGGKWLQYRGHLTHISSNFLEGAFNAFTHETGHGTNRFTGAKGVRLSDLAREYTKEAGGFVVVGDENYGEGSSREHAAMSSRFLGARVVLARSFARIHEANLKRQGVLAFTFSEPQDYEAIQAQDRLSFPGLSQLSPAKPFLALLHRGSGPVREIQLAHTLTREQIQWFRAGSALNALRRRLEEEK